MSNGATKQSSPILDCLAFPSALMIHAVESGGGDDDALTAGAPVMPANNEGVSRQIPRTMLDSPQESKYDNVAQTQQQLASLNSQRSMLVSRKQPSKVNNNLLAAPPALPVPRQAEKPLFSGGSPLSKRSTPYLPMCHRDFETSIEVQVSCMKGVKEGFVFSGDRGGVQLFLYCLKSKAQMLGVDEATYIVKDGIEFSLTEFGVLTRVSVEDARKYEAEVNTKAQGGDPNAARLIQEFLFLKILVTSPYRLDLASSCDFLQADRLGSNDASSPAADDTRDQP
eukprot:CAMPEP_0116006460 /NCGR_PEP_ID=MMETSP0321-20121206/1741_1 /TAXON_ID=163516 /ORGANISM="Leptocylindrus danicus var. danicus, Strain B650" /LENGTH=281 /DNA_ID=CAMNT_0003475017 /DNA_START=78 /DNA_END=928 /DNA_ORIENTATION=+